MPSYFTAVRYGGPIVSVHGLCKALAARGHDVHVFTTNVDGSGDSAVPLGIPVDLDGVKVWYFKSPVLRRLYWAPRMREALCQHVGSFDVVHTHSVFLWPTWAAGRIARRQRVPYVVSPRGMLVRDLIQRKSRWVKRTWIALIERKNVADASLVHFTSQLETDEAAALGLTFRGCCIVPNGLDMPAPEDAAENELPDPAAKDVRPYLLFVGRISWKKGLDRLIAALAGIPGCRLVVAGNDEEGLLPRLEALAAQADVGDRTEFVGSIYGEEKTALYRNALMLVLPSYSENFGNVVLEAMAAGCPVVVTPEVGAADIVRESGGGAVLGGDPNKLARGIQDLVDDPEALKRMGERGRNFVSMRYTWETVCLQMEDAYRRVIAG